MVLLKAASLFTILGSKHLATAFVVPAQQSLETENSSNKYNQDDNDPLPLIIWHGLGDSYASESQASVAAAAQAVHPGTYVYHIRLNDDAKSDRSLSFFGNVSSQLEQVCADLASHPIISTAPAVDALGFSQGGQFLRGYIERCNNPPVRSLVTFGAQHSGISKIDVCARTDLLCKIALGVIRSNTWSSFIQSYLVPAQYLRDSSSPEAYEQYLANSNFLADINNERSFKNEMYRNNMARLERFAMYIFQNDETVVPKESGWFSEVNGSKVSSLRELPMYKEDWLGLRALDEKGALRFETSPGSHMELSNSVLKKAFEQNFGPYGRKFEGLMGQWEL